MRRALVTLFAAAAVIAVVLGDPLVANAQTVVPLSAASLVGYDVSTPQCSGATGTCTLPEFPAFGIVAVNSGTANTTNPYLAQELAWARDSVGGTSQRAVQAYVNTGNPGHAGAWWPTTNRTESGVAVKSPYGSCTGSTSRACAYVYGYSRALDDVTSRMPSNAGVAVWWLDVEYANTWKMRTKTIYDTASNRASLEGMTVALHRAGKTVGLYASHQQWKAITGTTPASSPLAKLGTWLAGSTTSTGAANLCSSAALTPGGRVVLAQYTPPTMSTSDVVYDHDVACLRLATAKPTISGIDAPHHRLTAHAGTWTPATKLTYQWRRSGHDIVGATAGTYTPATRDLRHSISVRVSGSHAGYSVAARTSSPRTIATALTRAPTPTFGGSVSVGHVLAAHAGRWAPARVTLRYQWLRNGTAIAGATHPHHTVTSADAGATLAVSVRGAKSGFAAVTKTSSAVSVPLQ